MGIKVEGVYTLNLKKLAVTYGLGTDISGYQIVEQGVRDFDGRLTDQKSLIMITCDEQERFVVADGARVEVLDIDDYDGAILRDYYGDTDDFTLDIEDAELALEED